MKKVAFYTLGCKVNQYETQAIARLFEKEGYRIVDFSENADVYVINTCTVTGMSARKSRQIIRRAKNRNEDSIIVAVGCYAQTAPEEIENIPGVNLIVGTNERHRIVDYVKQIESGKRKLKIVDNIMKVKDFEELKVDTHKGHARAYLKIQEGCSQFCAYCIIPYARGPIRSRDPKNIIDEVRKLADNGFKEVVLTGIHLASYGRDMRGTSLLDIIKRVHEIDGIERIRLGSIEPSTITEEFVKEVSGLNKLCPHYHISLQSGCDETLKRMNRRYTTSEYRKAVELLRDRISDVALTTDVMVGFPGETEEEFHKTYMFLDEISFSRMHIFKYSPRRGTPAASFNHQVSPQIKEKRSNILIGLSKRKTLEFNKKFEGRIMTVLLEQEVEYQEGFIEGLTANYIRTVCKGDAILKGKILNVRLDMAKEDFMIGNIVSL
jgi:threonylcarbamoyladenosine tRNA methylthiotransferase MtaB